MGKFTETDGSDMITLVRLFPKEQGGNISERLNDLAKIRLGLVHENIGRTYTYAEDQNFFYYASGYYDGGNLQLTLDKLGRITELKAQLIFSELAQAMQYLQ